jgi:hypothetical protein
MKIRLHPSDCERLGVPEVIDFDTTQIGLREAAALQKVTGLDPDELFKALNAKNLEALAALVWLVVGRQLGKRPDWDTFDVNAAIDIEGDEEEDPGKGEGSETDQTSTS